MGRKDGRYLTRHVWCLGFLVTVFSLCLRTAYAAPHILDIRHWSAPSSTRVVVELSDQVDFGNFSLKDPPRVVVDLSDVRITGEARRISIGDSLVGQLRVAMHSPKICRLVLDLEKVGFEHKVFLIPKVQNHPYRLVIHVDSPELGERIEQARRSVQQKKLGRALVVVIDPGHGGEDPGAIGVGGTKEKDIVLSIAKVLADRLDRNSGIHAFLTRKGDYFLSLGQRVAIAQEYGADFFVSIHADSSKDRRTRGASIYCLSLRGATDEAARILAEKENASDLIGGVRLDGDWSLNSILLDLVQTQTINDSLRWGGMVLGELERVHRLKFSMPRQAGFRVLRAPDIPSILVEVGFLTNPQEERLLNRADFHRLVASALEHSICGFLQEQRSIGPDQLALGVCGDSKFQFHIVQPGQSLSKIASLYHTTINELQRVNDLNDTSRIYPGQEIRIP